MQFAFKENGEVTVYYGSSVSEQKYSVKGDTLTLQMEVGKGQNIRSIITKYIIVESENEIVLKEYNTLLNDDYFLRKYYFKNNNGRLIPKEKDAHEPIFTIVEEMPAYPGGLEELKKFIANEVAKSVINENEKVFIKLLINTEGKIEESEILTHPKLACVEEAMKIIRKLSQFTPGKQSGTPVYVYFNLPVKFQSR